MIYDDIKRTPMWPFLDMQEVLLRNARFEHQQQISERLARRVEYGHFMDHQRGVLVQRVVADVLYEQHEPVTVTYPETWLDAVLDRWCPRRLMERWPKLQPSFVTVTVDPRTYYPSLTPQDGAQYEGAVTRVMVIRDRSKGVRM